jgi:hypothetical protein
MEPTSATVPREAGRYKEARLELPPAFPDQSCKFQASKFQASKFQASKFQASKFQASLGRVLWVSSLGEFG